MKPLPRTIPAAVKHLDQLYTRGEVLMLKPEGKEAMSTLLPQIKEAFTKLMLLSSNIPPDDIMPGASLRKSDYQRGYEEFVNRVDQWQIDVHQQEKPIPHPRSSLESLVVRSRTGSMSTTSSMRSLRKREALAKMEHARLLKEQNEARRREEDELQQLRNEEEAFLQQQKDMETRLAQKRAQLQRRSEEAEDNRRIEAARLEAAVWQDCSMVDYASQHDGISVSRTREAPLLTCQPPLPQVGSTRDTWTISQGNNYNYMHENVYQQPPHAEGITKREPDALQHPSPAPRYLGDSGEQLLPKPNIRKFEGDPMDFWAFWNRFRIYIVNWLPQEKKISYLLQHCSKEVSDQIQHYADSHSGEDSYERAWQELKRRYGQPHIIAHACEEKLRAVTPITKHDPERLERLSVLLKRCCSSLEDVTEASNLDTVQFITCMVTKLPMSLREQWVRSALAIADETNRVAGFRDLTAFISEQSRIANSVYGIKVFSPAERQNKADHVKIKSSSFNATTEVSKPTQSSRCIFCEGAHRLHQCKTFKDRPFSDREKFVRDHRLCFNCLSPNHFRASCVSKGKCQKLACGSTSHHTLLHPPSGLSRGERFGANNQTSSADAGQQGPSSYRNRGQESNSSQVHSLHTVSRESCTYLDIVPVRVLGGKEEVHTYALLDSGSNRSFCEKRLIDQLGLCPGDQSEISIQTLSRSNPETFSSTTVSLDIGSLDKGEDLYLEDVIVIDNIPTDPVPAPSANYIHSHDYLDGVNIASIDGGSVTLLIGNDNVMAHRCLESCFAPNPEQGPDAVRTPLGWMLRGTRPDEVNTQANVTNFLVRGYKWHHDAENIEELIITDEGETFSPSSDTGLFDKEDLMKFLQSHRELLEFGHKFSREDPIAYDLMTRKLEHSEGHYQLPLLWRNDAAKLPESLSMAMRRLNGLKKRLQKDHTLHQRYVEKMQETLDRGYAEVVPDDEVGHDHRCWFVPHHPVINPKKPEKLRIVYDCAAQSHGRSLNDFLLKGPDLMNSLVGVLLRFRKGHIAITADIEAMFYQVKVAPHDRDAMRFLWWPGGDLESKPVQHRMRVHLFGAKSSPSCATFCLRETANEYGKHFDPNVSSVVRKNFYVDDCLTSVSSVEEGIRLIKDLRQLLAMSGFKLTKWLSPNNAVLASVPPEDRSKAALNPMPSEGLHDRVLGVRWDVKRDNFDFTVELPDENPTKRAILSITNSLYDPLGFVAPVILEARLIYSSVCQKGIGWDETIDETNLRRWHAWKESLSNLKDITIPRCYKLQTQGIPTQEQLHFFSDASTVARGAVCYLRTIFPDSTATTSLVMGKSLLPGAGRHTVPRLELEAALDAVQLARIVKQELQLNDCPCFFWTDSMIVLQSLKADSKRFPTFPRNRLQKILAHTKIYDWHHVPSNLNPADLASRGTTTKKLKKSGLWLTGPDFLTKPPEEWPTPTAHQPVVTDEIFEIYKLHSKDAKVFMTSTVNSQGMEKLITHFSCLKRLKLATAWLLRFKNFLLSRLRAEQGMSLQGPISAEELISAEAELVKYEQRQSFPAWVKSLRKDGSAPHSRMQPKPIHKLNPVLLKGTLRVGGRLDQAQLPFETRHPAILSPDRNFTQLVILHHHTKRSKHLGEGHTLNQLCQSYWIVNAKVAIRKVLSSCLICRRKTAKPAQQLMAELPQARLQIGQPPFNHTGVDYFGPMTVRVGRSNVKRYGCLFTCLTTRAIHLEMAVDLTTSSFINALRRFIARRGLVKKVFSDNGTNFVGCERTLKLALRKWNQNQIHKYLRQQGITWSFNPPGASHMGGVWERMIRTVRQILLAIMPQHPLDDDTLHTLLLEVEDVVNSRPLTEVKPEVDGDLPLTPNHLLKLNTAPNMPPMQTNKRDMYHTDRYRHVQFLADCFWKRWVREYPRIIMRRSKWLQRRRNLQTNDLVLILDESTPRQCWPLGRITATFPDRHGDVRSATVKTANGLFERPITKLCLFIPCEEDEVRPDEEQSEVPEAINTVEILMN